MNFVSVSVINKNFIIKLNGIIAVRVKQVTETAIFIIFSSAMQKHHQNKNIRWKYIKVNICFTPINIIKLSSEEAIMYGTKYSRVGQVKFVENSLFKNLKWCGLYSVLTRLYHIKFCRGCLPQILLGPFLNTLLPKVFAG